MAESVAVDANDVIDELLKQIGQLSKENAILKVRLAKPVIEPDAIQPKQ